MRHEEEHVKKKDMDKLMRKFDSKTFKNSALQNWNHLLKPACGVDIQNIVHDESQERDNFKCRL